MIQAKQNREHLSKSYAEKEKKEIRRRESSCAEVNGKNMPEQTQTDSNIDIHTETVSNNPTVTSHNDKLIEDGLMSLAKDMRYLNQFQELFLQMIDDNSQQFPNIAKKSAWVLAFMVYTMLVFRRSGQTFGMEVCNLHIVSPANRLQLVRFMMAISFFGFGSIGASYYYQYTTQRQQQRQQQQQQQQTREQDDHSLLISENLRGSERRRRYEMLRQQMLQRASQVSNNPSNLTNTGSNSATNQQNMSSRESLDDHTDDKSWTSIKSRLKASLLFFGKTISTVTDSLVSIEGPHTIENQTSTNPSTFSLLDWVLRLHLARYLITGKYPTALHRLLQISYGRIPTNQRESLSITNESTRSIALIITVQAAAVTIRKLSNFIAERFVHTMGGTSLKKKVTAAPKVLFSVPSTKEQYPGATVNCSICRTMKRNHPAASSSCGHVFCWDCLYQWVSTMRPECPLCRSPCLPQDILPLHNYALKS